MAKKNLTDISGQKFGKLFAIKEVAPAKGFHRVWLCKCDCGTVKEVRFSHLIHGLTKSCGCLHHCPQNSLKLTGKRFGSLVVMGRVGKGKDNCFTWECHCDCGGIKIVRGTSLVKGLTKSCGCLLHRKGADNPNYKGGYMQKAGYLSTSVDGKSTLLHRMAMERHLGRKLTKDESIHHINGNRADNRIENLELWTGKHSSGQRVEEITKFCLDHLALYAPEYLADIEEEKCRVAI